jgi:hypothetical protein
MNLVKILRYLLEITIPSHKDSSTNNKIGFNIVAFGIFLSYLIIFNVYKNFKFIKNNKYLVTYLVSLYYLNLTILNLIKKPMKFV